MKIVRKSPDPFYLKGTKEIGILLIHGFTGSPSEMRLLGDFLNQKQYTAYAPLLAGHGISPEEMARTNKEDWWKSVVEAYHWLTEEKGYKHVIAIGLSMGGILALKLAAEKDLAAVVPLAAPVYVKDKRIGLARWAKYFKAYQLKKQNDQEIEAYLASYDRTPLVCVESLHRLMKEVRGAFPKIKIPALVMQGKRDETVLPESAQYIYDHIGSKNKKIMWYEKTKHIMTVDQEKDQIFEDILAFLEMIEITINKEGV